MSSKQPVKSIILLPRTILIQEMPARATKPLSNIINHEYVAEISSWIDRKSSIYSLTNTPYKFQLILRGSINGLASQTFWDTCHGHASTVIIMKVKGTEEILGDYNPLIWNANNYGCRKTSDSFIFLLKNGDIQNSILSRVKIRENAIWNAGKSNQANYSPYFENGLDSPIRTTNSFSIVDYEVFKVIKKTS
ncbi:hypothetical protein Glove_199g65 [Diversispora epigaea]|uniref:TLDc domain-containing protein n=1 Tax=Diversispora epigaea TaxID=1348612 RepID=A0A397IJR4_9GLOM|nr:hypothetical protein Glove_199g65 [Diversispora epigaea]